MGFITFIYRIEGDKQVYYGKYIYDYLSDDHEGLDNEVRPYLNYSVNKHRKQNGLSKLKDKQISIGILSFSEYNYIPTDSSKDEIQCFDFYYDCSNNNSETYINGKLI